MYKVETDISLLLRNMKQYRWILALLFSAICLAGAVVGFLAKKEYMSYSTLLFESSNKTQNIIDEDAISGDQTDWFEIANQIIFSRKTMNRLMNDIGLIEGPIKTKADDILVDQVKRRIVISQKEDKFLEIGYVDADPTQAREIVEKLTNIFLDESKFFRIKDSQEAFDFVDRQVKIYKKQLDDSQNKLKEFEAEKIALGVGNTQAVQNRLRELQADLGRAELDLSEAYIRETALKQQVGRASALAVNQQNKSQLLARRSEISIQLATLRLNYQEDYPDIVELKAELRGLERSIATPSSTPNSVSREAINNDPVVQDLNLQLANATTIAATLQSRVESLKENIELEKAKGKEVQGTDVIAEQVTRDYEVNKGLYERLVEQREKARVALDVDLTNQASKIEIYESAFTPATPLGLRYMHYLLASLLVGLLLPLVLIYIFQLTDKRIKSVDSLKEEFPKCLGQVSHLRIDTERAKYRWSSAILALMLISVVVVVALMSLKKLLVAV